jgi:hypothetical protein
MDNDLLLFPGRVGILPVFNLYIPGATKNVLGLEGSEALMQKKEKKEFEVLTVKDEKAFFTLIEERLEEQGFQLVDTFNRSSRQESLAGMF